MRIKPNADFILVRGVLLRMAIGLFLPILVGVGAQAAFGADFWETEDYTKWSEKECTKMLTNSPWATRYVLTEKFSSGSWPVGDGQDTYTVTYQVQLYSALPIRQAIVRQSQILQNYERLSPEQKNQFDKSAEALLGADNEEVVVLNISYMTNHPPYDLDMARYWQIQTTDMLKNSTYLKGSKGEKVPISTYVVFSGAQRGFRFIFPRKYEDGKVLEPEDKSLLLEFVYPAFEDIGKSRTGFVEFKTSKMMFNGRIEY